MSSYLSSLPSSLPSFNPSKALDYIPRPVITTATKLAGVAIYPITFATAHPIIATITAVAMTALYILYQNRSDFTYPAILKYMPLETFEWLHDKFQFNLLATDHYGRTFFHHARTNPKLMEFLLTKEKTSLDEIRDNNKYLLNPLQLAAINGDLETVKILIEKGQMDPNAGRLNPGNYEYPPIYHATINGHLDVVKYLITKQAKTDALKMPYLIEYIRNEELVEYVLTTLAEEVFGAEAKTSPFLCALGLGAGNTALRIGSRRDVDASEKDSLGRSAVHYAAMQEYSESVYEAFQKAGFIDLANQKDVQDSNGCTPLHYAAQAGNETMTTALITAGANVHLTDEEGKTPLHYAAQADAYEIIKLLITEGADRQAKDSELRTPLHYVAMTPLEHALCIPNIFDGIDDNSSKQALLALTDNKGKTPPMLAAETGNVEALRRMRGFGKLDLQKPIKADSKTTLLHVAAQHDQAEVMEMLPKELREKDDDDTNTALHLAAAGGHVKATNWLLANAANLTTKKNSKGETALHAAMDSGSVEIAIALVREDKKLLTTTDTQNNHVLHRACAQGKVKLVEWLMREHAKLANVENTECEIPRELVQDGPNKAAIFKALGVTA